MSIKIVGDTSGNVVEVDANKNLKATLPAVLSQGGYAVLAGESHDGSAGASVIRRAAGVSPGRRLRAGLDNILWSDTFNHTLLAAEAYQAVTSTMTLVVGGGVLSFNNGASVASAAVCRVQTYKTFPLLGSSALEASFRVRFTINAQTNNVAELGLGIAATTATPTDGAYFKMNTSGGLEGVANFNGTEFTTSLGITPTSNRFYYLRMILDQGRLEFYVDDVCRGKLDLSDISGSLANPATTFARALPLLMRLQNSAVTSSAQKMEVSDVTVINYDLANNKDWPTSKAGMCENSIAVPRGTAAGFTANFVNSAAPTSATLSNTAAGYTTLGGQWQFAAVLGAETDYALFGYQVPATAVAGANKNLYIKRIRIEACNTVVAVATTATLLQWGIGIGSTAVSLQTADSLTGGTRAPRKLALGLQTFPVGATVGATATPIDITFNVPLFAEAGTFVHVILKMPVATNTATEVFRGTVLINGFFE